MRTPEEIILGLELCSSPACHTDACPYYREDREVHIGDCDDVLMGDALQLIRQLTTQNETQADTIKQLIAAIGDHLPRPRRKEEQT